MYCSPKTRFCQTVSKKLTNVVAGYSLLHRTQLVTDYCISFRLFLHLEIILCIYKLDTSVMHILAILCALKSPRLESSQKSTTEVENAKKEIW